MIPNETVPRSLTKKGRGQIENTGVTMERRCERSEEKSTPCRLQYQVIWGDTPILLLDQK